jgi:hypothetical protein
MEGMKPIPGELTAGVFTREGALAAGVTRRMLDGSRFVRVTPRVWRHRDHVMTSADWRRAASLTLPSAARTTGITRLQQLGLDYGPRLPLRFVVEGELHLDLHGIFLHRTKLMPPCDEQGVSVEAAFLAYCARARLIEAIKVGDWLLYGRHTSTVALQELALAQPWRPGAAEVLVATPHLNGGARSLKESELRAVLAAVGLPRPEVNATLDRTEDAGFIVDLWYRRWCVAVEYEGSHHQEDRAQYNSDIDRYALIRRVDIRYVQVTKEKLARPALLVGEVFRELVANGYTGAPPSFGPQWDQLFVRLSTLVSSRARRGRRAVG